MAKSRTAAPAFTTILLVRHGNTPTTGKVLPGAKGLSLSDTGRNQAKTAAERIAASLEWTQFTAHLLNGPEKLQHRLPLNEVSRQRLTEAYSSANSEIGPAPNCRNSQSCPSGRQCSGAVNVQVPNGESFTEMQVRMVSTLDRLRSAHPVAPSCASHMPTRSKRPLRTLLVHTLISSNELSSPHARYQLSHGHHTPAVLAVNTTAGPIGDLALS